MSKTESKKEEVKTVEEVQSVNELVAIQSELKAPKGQYNSYGKYHYRNAEDILEALKPLLNKYQCQLVLTDEPVLIGQRFYIKASAIFTDSKGRKEVVTAYAREAENRKGMDESQITGSASSYARKYALNGLFLIDDTKDADTDEHKRQTTQGGNYTGNNWGNNYQPQNNAALDAKRQLFRNQLQKLSQALKSPIDNIQHELIEQAKNVNGYHNMNQLQQATVLVQKAGEMINAMGIS